MSDKLDKIARDFQEKMVALGLGVNIQTKADRAVTVTTYCEKHGVSAGPVCPQCVAAG